MAVENLKLGEAVKVCSDFVAVRVSCVRIC